ncbi:MAG: glycosyl hydrolase family 38 [Bacteroidales bacterium]|nr:glycosyl hydrolase family 38 [Bacteroidales bacterium]
MKRLFILLGISILLFHSLNAQSFITSDDFLINGYAKKNAGLDYEYHSCIPGLRESFLVRALNGKDYVEWETEKVPSGIKQKYGTITWVAAIGSSPGKARMVLNAGDNLSFEFYTDGRRTWEIPGAEGSSLSFHSIMVDQNGDNHGYMVLRIPSDKIKAGIPLKIKVTGSAANLTSWYMPFKKQVKTGVTLNAFPAIMKKGTSEVQLVEAGIFYFGQKADAKIFADGKLLENVTLNFGYNAVNLGLPPVSKPSKIELKVTAGDFSVKNIVTLNPVKRWKISFIQHSHTDIGYTRSQTEILAEHLRYIDYALDYCDATDNYPENAKFRWTCEASWPVDEYLKCRPQSQIDRLLKRINEGRIEVTGMYFNFDEIPDEKILATSLEAVGRIKEKGIPVKLAMQNDVNGIGWCMNDYFNQVGIKYLNMGTHGHRALICFDKPTMFWWESPSGQRILTFRAEHYMTGNTVLEMQSGDLNRFKNNLMNYLISLDSKKYPFDEMAIQHSGYLTDNSPPSSIASDLIKEWNETFLWPQLSTSTAESFFAGMEKSHSGEFQVIRGAWPDWWTDGFGASARETAASRIASSGLIANVAGLGMASSAGIKLPADIDKKIDLADNALLFYTEHTAGYSESVREPYSQQTMEQRALKDSYAWEANRRTASIGEEAMGLLQSMFTREKEPSFLVFNTLNWKRSGLTTVYIDHQIMPRGKTPGIFDRDGKRIPVQALSHRSDGTTWALWLNDVPAFGYKKYLIKQIDEKQSVSTKEKRTLLENKWYKITADPVKGAIISWFDKDLGIELIDPKSNYKMGEFILEQLGNRSQMESKRLDDFKRSPLDTVWFDSYSEGEIWNTIKFFGESETTVNPKGYSFEIRLYNTEKRLDLACSIVKKSIISPESFYIAFPINIIDGKHFLEVPGGIIEAGIDQIKGSSNDWYTVQNFTSVRNGSSQLVMGCAEMPLMQLGAINTGRYTAGALPQSTNIFSWPMNNYWVTNFNAEQRGGHTWTYYLTTSADNSAGFATRFGWGCRVPYLTRILPGEGTGDKNWEGAFLTGWPENVILISADPAADGKSLIIHLRETAGKETALAISNGITGKSLTAAEVDAAGKNVVNPSTKIGALNSKFYRITF